MMEAGMKAGDLIVFRTRSTAAKPALVLEVTGDGYVRVLTEGQVMWVWVPISYMDVIHEVD
jgi:hypothetical protein